MTDKTDNTIRCAVCKDDAAFIYDHSEDKWYCHECKAVKDDPTDIRHYAGGKA